jgi:nucleotide-binding universal stress UspA family protein
LAIGSTEIDDESLYVSTMTLERWIVVGTDFSDGAQRALERALGLAEESGARVALVHAYEEVPGGNAPGDPTPKLLGDLTQEIQASGATRRGVYIEPLVRRGAPWDKLLNVATDYGAELVVIGSSGQRGSIRGFPLGSVASRVLALSTRSVLVVPQPAASELDY